MKIDDEAINAIMATTEQAVRKLQEKQGDFAAASQWAHDDIHKQTQAALATLVADVPVTAPSDVFYVADLEIPSHVAAESQLRSMTVRVDPYQEFYMEVHTRPRILAGKYRFVIRAYKLP